MFAFIVGIVLGWLLIPQPASVKAKIDAIVSKIKAG